MRRMPSAFPSGVFRRLSPCCRLHEFRVLVLLELPPGDGRNLLSMLPTPSTSHVDVDRIYEPAEDSFLLLDTLSSQAETAFLQERFNQRLGKTLQSPSPLFLEVGTGSGVVTAFITAHAQEIFGRADVLTLGVDVNGYACAATGETVRGACGEKSKNHSVYASCGVYMTCVRADLGSIILPNTIDILVFNPPYVPSAELPRTLVVAADECVNGSGIGMEGENHYEETSHLLSLSYAGGKDGMEVTNRLLNQLPELLDSDRGTAYILLCRQNKPETVMERVRLWGPSWAVEVVGRSGKTGGWEKLQVLRIWRA